MRRTLCSPQFSDLIFLLILLIFADIYFIIYSNKYFYLGLHIGRALFYKTASRSFRCSSSKRKVCGTLYLAVESGVFCLGQHIINTEFNNSGQIKNGSVSNRLIFYKDLYHRFCSCSACISGKAESMGFISFPLILRST